MFSTSAADRRGSYGLKGEQETFRLHAQAQFAVLRSTKHRHIAWGG